MCKGFYRVADWLASDERSEERAAYLRASTKFNFFIVMVSARGQCQLSRLNIVVLIIIDSINETYYLCR